MNDRKHQISEKVHFRAVQLCDEILLANSPSQRPDTIACINLLADFLATISVDDHRSKNAAPISNGHLHLVVST